MIASLVPSKLFVLSAVLVGAAASSRAARADESPAEADRRPAVALAACASGDVAKGIAILGELYAETRNPTYVFNQGRCYQKNNQLEQARGSFAEYLRIGTSEPPEDIQRAQGFVKEIDDALAQQRASAPAPLLVAPVARADDAHPRALRTASLVLAAVGVAAIGAGVYLSFKVKATNDAINRDFANQPYVTDEARLEQQLSDGKSYETWQWVGYGVGVAALAGAATTLVLAGGFGGSGSGPLEHAVAVAPTLSPDGIGGVLRVRF
jgi:hypothetical protein